MSRSRTTASQNHAMSCVERAVSSSSEPIPCARISRVTFACSIVAASGVQTNRSSTFSRASR